jgi:hypothetical protein
MGTQDAQRGHAVSSPGLNCRGVHICLITFGVKIEGGAGGFQPLAGQWAANAIRPMHHLSVNHPLF